MEIVIEISDDTYKYWKEVKPMTSNIYVIDAVDGIRNGTPLSKNATNRDVIKNIFGKYFSIPLATTNEWLDSPYERDESE